MGKLKKVPLYTLIILLSISMAIFSYVFSNKTKVIETLSYDENSNIDYQVCLKENIFYEEKCQPKNMKYIASAINYIDIIFTYDFETAANVNYAYEYYIDGIITVFDRNDSSNILFTKTINILDTKKLEKNETNRFNISESLKINYHEYNDLIKAFKSEYNISADSSLKLKLYIKNSINYEKFNDQIEAESELELTIPLTENTINIGISYKEINNTDSFIQPAGKTIFNTIWLVLSISLGVLSLIFTILLMIEVQKKRNQKSAYERFISNKVKNLDRMIVSTQENIKIDENYYDEILDVKTFSELVDIAERLADVIAWTEVVNEDETVSWFSVADKKRLYRIIYKSSDLEFK